MSKNIDKYLTKDELKTLNSLINAMQIKEVNVTCVGLYNSGKSTLLNVLIKDFEYKTFKVEDVRETTLNKSVIFNNIKYVDTPGLNAQKNDDKKVMKAIQNSDITLFVHNVTTGEFNKAEINFLISIQKYWKNPQEFIDKTIFVLSRIDDITNYEDIENTSKKMKKQIKDIFYSFCMVIPVSSKDYKEGVVNNEEELVSESNIKILEEGISLLNIKYKESMIKIKRKRLEDKFYELELKINEKIKINQQSISHLKQQQKAIDDNFKNDIKKIERTLKNMYKQLKDI